MKNLPRIFICFYLTLFWSCVDITPADENAINEPIASAVCDDNYASYYFNETIFETAYNPAGGEILTPSGENCGIGMVYDTNSDFLTFRILGEDQQLRMSVKNITLNEQLEFNFIEYTNMNSSYTELLDDHENYIFFEEFNGTEKLAKGTFSFQIENSEGEVMDVSEGAFNSFYSEF